MKTYQDFLASDDIESFIVTAIDEFKGSKMYEKGIEARCYYNGENSAILARTPYIYSPTTGQLIKDNYRANNTVPSNFVGKIVRQQTSYLFANGVTMDDNIKDKLDSELDLKLRDLGKIAQLDGIAWAYVYLDKGKLKLAVWDGIAFIPLYDERTSELMAGIRFWQLEANRPTYVELYEIEGKSDFKVEQGTATRLSERTPYKVKRRVNEVEDVILSNSNWSKLPILALPYNDGQISVFSSSLKMQIDVYDKIQSDFANNLEDSKDVFWVLKNYGGQDLGQFLSEYKEQKVIQIDDEGDARPETIEVPYQARETALKLLEQNIYKTAMALDTGQLAESSLTATAIKSLFVNLDLKTDELERYALGFMKNLLSFYDEQFAENVDTEVEFIRRTIMNDTETIANIVSCYTTGIMSKETAIEKNPYIDDAIKEMERLDKEDMEDIKTQQQQINNKNEKDDKVVE